MTRPLATLSTLALVGAAFTLGRLSAPADARAATPVASAVENGSMVEHDSLVAKKEPGTHGGGGQTTGYNHFATADGLKLVFRKRAMHPGSAIGYHQHRDDEIYYVISGRGEYTLDGVKHLVGPGDALLTRNGSSHGLKQVGTEDLVILINYEQRPRVTKAPGTP
jgi:quercetin dioxygenase-like cupin family protein